MVEVFSCSNVCSVQSVWCGTGTNTQLRFAFVECNRVGVVCSNGGTERLGLSFVFTVVLRSEVWLPFGPKVERSLVLSGFAWTLHVSTFDKQVVVRHYLPDSGFRS